MQHDPRKGQRYFCLYTAAGQVFSLHKTAIDAWYDAVGPVFKPKFVIAPAVYNGYVEKMGYCVTKLSRGRTFPYTAILNSVRQKLVGWTLPKDKNR